MLKSFPEKSWNFLEKKSKCVEELKFGMNELFNNVFKAYSFLKFREVHFWSYWKKMLVRNMRKVYTRLTSASDFFKMCSKNYNLLWNARHEHGSTKTAVTFWDFNFFAIQFLTRLDFRALNVWSFEWLWLMISHVVEEK
jgi:hypothetical protein